MTEDNKPKVNKSFCRNCFDRNYLIECECGCGGILFRRDKNRTIRRFKNGHGNKGQRNGNYKFGRKIQKGYWYILLPDYFSSTKSGYMLEHVYFYQEYWQCCMLPWGVVHHIDENKDNNMPWNLQGMIKSQHIRLHKTGKTSYKKDMTNRFCRYCSNKTYVNKNGWEQWYGDEINGFWCRKCNDRIRRDTLLMVIGN